MSNYAIVQVARALAPAIGLLGVGGIAVVELQRRLATLESIVVDREHGDSR